MTTCPEATVRHHQGESIGSALNLETFYASLRLYFRKRLGPARFAFLELLLIGVFAASAVYSWRPRSCGHDGAAPVSAHRDRWRYRIFLRPSTPVRKP